MIFRVTKKEFLRCAYDLQNDKPDQGHHPVFLVDDVAKKIISIKFPNSDSKEIRLVVANLVTQAARECLDQGYIKKDSYDSWFYLTECGRIKISNFKTRVFYWLFDKENIWNIFTIIAVILGAVGTILGLVE